MQFLANTPVTVYVYLNSFEMWCTTEPLEFMGGYLIQTIKAIPSDRPVTPNEEDEIEVGDVFALDNPDAPLMVRVEYFEKPTPKFVVVIENGCIVNAYSLSGDSDFAYAVIDLDNPEVDDDGNDMPTVADVYVVDGTADSVEQIISEL